MAKAKSPRAAGAEPRAEAGYKKMKTSSFLKSLPESVEHIEIVQQVACVVEELQKRVLDVRAEASKELKKLLKLYENNYKGLEKKVHQVTLDAKKQATTSMIQLLQKWHEHKERLPAPLAKEIEKLVEQIGAKVVERQMRPKKSAPAKAPRTAKTTTSSTKAKAPVKKKAKAPTAKSTAASSATPKRRIKAKATPSPKIAPMTGPVDDAN